MMRPGRASSTATRRGTRHHAIRRALVGHVIGGVAAAGAAGCSDAAREPGVVVYASGADLESANPLVAVHPLSRQVQRFALLVTLCRLDEGLRPQPYLARSWEWSADRRTLTLRLFAGLRWHDGAPTTARDAAFTFAAVRDPATGSPRRGELAALLDAAAPDDSTLVLHFAAAQPEPPRALCDLPIAPAHLLAAVPRPELRRAPFNLAPVGNGPFRFGGRRPGERWVFERNPDFPPELGGPPRVRRLVIAVVDEAATKFAGLVSGELDVAGIAPTMAALTERDPRLRVLAYPVLFSTALVVNPHRPPFDDARVRRALALAVDRHRIVDAALAGFGVPAAGPVAPENPLAAPPAGPLRDTLAADSLLDAAGWQRAAEGQRRRDGRAFEFELLTVGTGDNALEQLLQADLAARGIGVRIRQVELGAFLAAARRTPRAFDALLAGIPGDLALGYLAAMYDSRLAGSALDYAGFHTPALDAAFAAAERASTPRQVGDAWREVQAELAREMPAVWLYHARGVQGVSRRLDGVVMDLRGELATLHEWTTGDVTEAR
jgi:peptide/nickel transport system substrate-binding protein